MLKRKSFLFGFMLSLTLLLVKVVFAQTPLTVETPAPLESDRFTTSEMTIARLNRTADITFTPAITLYLPAISLNYVSCTAVPALLSPANGATLNTLVPLFRWNSGNDPRATEFTLDASKDLSFDYTEGLRSSYDAQGIHEGRLSWNFDPGTTYYWHAYLMCGDIQGPYSDIWTFTTGSGGTMPPGPNLVSPADGTTLAGTTVTLRWSPVAGAVEYNVYQKKAGSYAVYWRENGTEATLLGLAPNTTYEWWITARNDYAWGAESLHRHFITGPSGAVNTSTSVATQTCRSQRHAATGQDCLLEETGR